MKASRWQKTPTTSPVQRLLPENSFVRPPPPHLYELCRILMSFCEGRKEGEYSEKQPAGEQIKTKERKEKEGEGKKKVGVE